MVSLLVSWLLGIEEDDPIPFEIKHIYFYLEQNILGMAGTELERQYILDFEYYPTESQFFDFQKEYFNKNPLIRLKNLISDVMDNENIRKVYFDKHIHIGYLNQEILYSFVVNWFDF